MGKKTKEATPDHVGFGTLMVWSSRGISVAVQTVLIGYLSVYCTNALGLSAALVGTLLMASKIVDSVTDLVAGYIVDRTNTKIGRGRPYELCIIGLWLATWLCFTVPESLSTTAKCIWIVLCYIMAQSIFYTLLGASQNVYMVRAFNNNRKYITLSSIGGLLTTFCVIIFNVAFPMMEADIVNSAPGWSRLIFFLAAPLTIIGIMRFLFIKEEYNVDAGEEHVKFSDVFSLLKNNKNVYPIALVFMASSIGTGYSVSQYYYLYIVGDLGIMGVMSIFSVAAMFTLLFYPKILRKMSVKRLVQMGLLFSLVGGLINFFAGANFGLLALAGILNGIATLPLSYMGGLLNIECADYNEWQNRPRMEGTIGAVTGFAGKVGSALSSFLGGVLLTAAGFDGALEVQSDSALFMIRFVFALLPTIFCMLAGIVLNWYKLDKLKPQIDEDIAKRRTLQDGGTTEEKA